MLIPKTFIFIAVSYLSATTSANSLDHILHSGNGNYIIQLNQTTCIKHCMFKIESNKISSY